MLRTAAHIILLAIPAITFGHGADSVSGNRFSQHFRNWEAGGYVRSFTMATFNEGSYRDFVSSAFGGGLNCVTPSWKGFRLGGEVLAVTELFSNDLLEKDPASGFNSKWEMELYNIEKPSERNGLFRLSKAYIEYRKKGALMRFGRQTFQTPLLNPRDGRMMPFQHGGMYFRSPIFRRFQTELGIVRSVSVRSTTSWYDLNDAIGMVSSGKTESGTNAVYRYRTGTEGLAFAKLSWENEKGMSVEIWDFYLDKLNNTVWAEVEKDLGKLEFGVQVVAQSPALNTSADYIQGSGRSYTGSFRVLRKLGKNRELSLNATRVSKAGKFLFPRELGRESFYTSLPRCRMEGLGGTSAYSVQYTWHNSGKDNFSQDIQCAVYDVPQPYDFALNKYEVTDYLNLNIRNTFSPSFADERLEFDLLYVYRHNLSKGVSDPRLIVNKTNFNQINFVINAFF
ncbi:MAG: hypothetical protein H6606_02325 [Flavobacteriales bacterium]|nr:hypothetical protein [Flavobacteriales bacterium]